MPKIFGAKNLSADEIAVLLGFTDAADFTASLDAKIANSVLTTNGDLLTRTAGVPARLGLGSPLQVLRTNAGATAVEFADPAGGAGAPLYTPSTKTTGYTATTSDNYLRCNHASTPFTITLPAATGSGRCLTIKNIGAAVVTVDGNASETIDGATTITLAQYSSVSLVDAASGAWDII